jgi:hypothetical protein
MPRPVGGELHFSFQLRDQSPELGRLGLHATPFPALTLLVAFIEDEVW